MIREAEDRRWKVIHIHPGQILELFSAPTYENYSYAKFVGLPKEYIIDSVSYDQLSQMFDFVIYSPEFPIVRFGQRPPVITVQYEVKKINLKDTNVSEI